MALPIHIFLHLRTRIELARCHNYNELIGVDEGECCWVYFDVAKEGKPCVFISWGVVHHYAGQGKCFGKDCYGC